MIHDIVRQKLEAAFPGAKIEVVDTSAGHESHNSLTNLAVSIMWDGFKDQSLIDQHRAVNVALKDELKTEIHALRIETRTP